MDNPQHYQPLSHALNPPLPPNQTLSYPPTSMYSPKPAAASVNHHRNEEEEEEEEDDDEGIVEEQLHERDDEDNHSNHSSSKVLSTGPSNPQNPPPQPPPAESATPQKRARGRPKGSRNRVPRPTAQLMTKEPGFQQHQVHASLHPPATGVPPQLPDVNAQNQQYYEFQWRVLNLCAEFYGAAEELVKATPPLVVAQCYHVGPTSKVDPLVMLTEAKRICDTLLANPSRLIANPPPPIYPVIPTLYPPSLASQAASTSTAPSASSLQPAVITNPQTFVVPLGTQPTYPHSQYAGVYSAPQYPTAPYYQYPSYAPPGTTYYTPPQPQTQPQQPQQPAAAQQQGHASSTPRPQSASATHSANISAATINQGTWSDEETERLKQLVEQSKNSGSTIEVDWDWVVSQWGAGRTRHQILIKATSLGLKESTSRGVKRRREAGPEGEAPSPTPVPPTSVTPVNNAAAAPPPSSLAAAASPALSHATTTPVASPALAQQPRPTPAQGKPASTATGSSLPWPMPTVAVNTPSPVIAVAAAEHADPQRQSYYRARPGQEPAQKAPGAPLAAHHYMYQPNGSRLTKENGK